MDINSDTTFISVKIGSGDTRLFPMEVGLSFLRILASGLPKNGSTSYSFSNPTYQIEFIRREDLEHQEINRLLDLERNPS